MMCSLLANPCVGLMDSCLRIKWHIIKIYDLQLKFKNLLLFSRSIGLIDEELS
jgi:hypothetical protein